MAEGYLLGILVDLDASAPVGALEGKFLVDDCGLRWWTGQAPSFSSTKPEPSIKYNWFLKVPPRP